MAIDANAPIEISALEQERPPEYLKEQPFDQVPTLRDGDLQMFESGEARPAFQRALDDQLSTYAANRPELEGATA